MTPGQLSQYEKDVELCRLAIAKADEQSSDWVNTIAGFFYRAQPHYGEEPSYSTIAITTSLLEAFVNRGSMPDTDIDLPFGFTKEARKNMQEHAEKFFAEELYNRGAL